MVGAMMLRRIEMKHILTALILVGASSASASTQSPYAGEELNEIKSLSPVEINDLLQGNGMGFAKAAELNQYPGPRHVLEIGVRVETIDSQ